MDGDPLSIERGVRQRLAEKISDNMAGLWLLVAEHLRLGTWDLLCGWTQQTSERLEPRLALQLVHEAALCTNGLREGRCLTLRGFETLNGLPFLANDSAVHGVLDAHTVADAQRLQTALGKIRRVCGHFPGKLLLIDPHRPPSASQRNMRKWKTNAINKPIKTGQCFFCLDGDSEQPLCFTVANSARTVRQASPELLGMAADILSPAKKETLVVADTEHLVVDLMDYVRQQSPFDLMVPVPQNRSARQRWLAIPPESFTRHWAGYATALTPRELHHSSDDPYFELVQRHGERPEDWYFNAFLSTTDRDPIVALTNDYPKRWHIEEFFNFNQSLGWKRAGTQNNNVRYGQLTMALIAQAVIHQFRQRVGPPFDTWDAVHLASAVFRGLDGDIRVERDTIVVTYYNAPNVELLRRHYERLPQKLQDAGISPQVPWLYGFRLDFRFK